RGGARLCHGGNGPHSRRVWLAVQRRSSSAATGIRNCFKKGLTLLETISNSVHCIHSGAAKTRTHERPEKLLFPCCDMVGIPPPSSESQEKMRCRGPGGRKAAGASPAREQALRRRPCWVSAAGRSLAGQVQVAMTTKFASSILAWLM